MTNEVTILISLPRDVFQALSAIAVQRGTQSHCLVEQLVERALKLQETPKQRAQRMRMQRVAELHALGMNDGEIARHLDLSGNTVWTYRNRMGLPPNAHGRPKINYDRQENAS